MAASPNRMRRLRKAGLWALAALGVLALAPVFALLGILAWYSATVQLCSRTTVLKLRLADADFVVPAAYRPDLSPASPLDRISRPSATAYCPPLFTRWPHQTDLIFTEASVAMIRRSAPQFSAPLADVKLISLSEQMVRRSPTPELPGEAVGPPLFGRATVYRCFMGFYDLNGETCRFDGWTPYGAGVRIDIHPRRPDADMARALTAAEQLLSALGEPRRPSSSSCAPADRKAGAGLRDDRRLC